MSEIMKRADRGQFVSAKQVAERAGVSRSAVSRTFTPGASVSPETRRRVMEAATALGYHVNHLARGLMRRESGIVCLVVADLDTPHLSRTVDILTNRLQVAGKVAMLINTASGRQSVEEALRQTLNYRADATIVLSGTPEPAIVRTCLESGQRMVLINRDDHLAGTLNVRVENGAAARTACAMFLADGRRHLALVSSGVNTPSLLEREREFVAAAEEIGRKVAVWHEGPTRHATGLEAARHLMAKRPRPDAIFCVTDLLACGVMDAVKHEFGLKVPDDVSIIGFDDIDQARWPSYELTTFAQPVDAMAEAIVKAIGAEPSSNTPRGESQPTEAHLSFAAPIVVRRSTCSPLAKG